MASRRPSEGASPGGVLMARDATFVVAGRGSPLRVGPWPHLALHPVEADAGAAP